MKQWNRYSILSSAEYRQPTTAKHKKADKYVQLFMQPYLHEDSFKCRLCCEDRNDTSEQRGLKGTECKPSEAEFLDVIGTKILKVNLLAIHSHPY
jgi:hypothetical protein